jgi:C4-dicarboxylate-specific signal transduction histidine kinase
MKRPTSLRRLLQVGTFAFALMGGCVMVAMAVMFVSLRRNFEQDVRARMVEQHAADEIVMSVYGQLLASYRQLQAPTDVNMEQFDTLGQRAYTRLREYLFQPMTLEARLQVETIKELHETLEVDAHRAFDLVRRGESAAARQRVGDLEERAGTLQREMDRFVALRERERTAAHDRQTVLLLRITIAIALIGILVLGYAWVFVRLVQRRVVAPLHMLSEASRQIGAGDLDARIPAQRHIELDTVAQSFNEMAARVRSTSTAIQQQNLELSQTLLNLKRTQQDLVQQEKMGAMGFMLAGLAHELNNPLAGILGSAQCAEEALEQHPDPEVRRVVAEFVTPLVMQSRRAGSLVRNLLHFSRKPATTLQTVNLASALDVAAGLRQHAYVQAGKRLEMNVPGDLWVAVDAQRLEHVAMNIMTNALDAMRSATGTKLVVRATATDPEWISLVFEDDGPGFRDPDRVFDAFYTTKAVGTGTGLGLTLVHRFVGEVGGTIAAENAPSGGARLTVRLRVACAPPAGSAPEQAATPPAPRRRRLDNERRVLVVDDEPALRSVQRRFLERMGLNVITAETGAEAAALLQREHVDLVITDIRMPGDMDGIALYRWIERHQPELAERCLFVSGDISEWGPDSAVGAHPERLLAKPFYREEYVQRVEAVFENAMAAA